MIVVLSSIPSHDSYMSGSDSDDVNESKCTSNNVNDASTEYIPRMNNTRI